jgi:hypothetical protein
LRLRRFNTYDDRDCLICKGQWRWCLSRSIDDTIFSKSF